jgi:hypothetical protein
MGNVFSRVRSTSSPVRALGISVTVLTALSAGAAVAQTHLSYTDLHDFGGNEI